ncbi:Succinate-semialdehyde dehydrogenase [Dirofilaria immitis]|nr:Succinate-semialdehyde dehydrogenase [Dirofilaria immitis]
MNGRTAYLFGRCIIQNFVGQRYYHYHTSLLPSGAKAFINGQWKNALSNDTFEIINPYNNEIICECANCDIIDAENCIKGSREAYNKWSLSTTAKERGEILENWHYKMLEKQNELAELITLEEGKPLEEARSEIIYSASFLKWFGEEARRIYGQIVNPASIHRTHLHTPAAALAIGCTVIVKPAEDTPLSALALAQIGKEVGLPDGVFNVIPADLKNTVRIAKFLCESTDVDAISFTGSSEVGKLLLLQSANTVKRVCLELGGNAPLIIFPSANLSTAIQGIMASKFRGSGQTCISPNRFYHAMGKLITGNGMQSNVTQGPLINEKAVQKIEKLLSNAIQNGASVILGGKRISRSTCFQPTLLTNVTNNMDIVQNEIFGPVLAIQKFETEEEVLKMANDCRTGLAGYIFTTDYAQILRVSRNLQVGIIGVNEGVVSCPEAAFGGMKESGLGREGGSQDLLNNACFEDAAKISSFIDNKHIPVDIYH